MLSISFNSPYLHACCRVKSVIQKRARPARIARHACPETVYITMEVQSVSHREPVYATVNDWIAREALPFSVDALEMVQSVIDKVFASSGSSVELLGLGEP